jgi:drug/metabolite transporter (DMT)-like permease
MPRDASALAIACLAIFLLTVMDAVIKGLTATFGVHHILLMRYGFGGIVAGLWFAMRRPGWPTGAQWQGHALRTGVMLVTASLFFYALGRVPLAELFVIVFLAPLFVAILGYFMLGEALTSRTAAGIGLGFLGLLAIVLSDPAARLTGGAWDGVAAALLSSLTYALASVLLRKVATQEPASRIVFVQSLIGLPLLALVALPTMPPLDAATLPMGMAVGLLGAVGSLMLSYAFSRAEAARVSTTEYTGLIWAALIGWLVFAEEVRPTVWIGAALIIAGCLLAMRGKPKAPATPPAGSAASP